MTYREAEIKIREIDKAVKYIHQHIERQFYYDNASWVNLVAKLKTDKAALEELINNEELDIYEEVQKEIDFDNAKFWGIEIITL